MGWHYTCVHTHSSHNAYYSPEKSLLLHFAHEETGRHRLNTKQKSQCSKPVLSEPCTSAPHCFSLITTTAQTELLQVQGLDQTELHCQMNRVQGPQRNPDHSPQPPPPPQPTALLVGADLTSKQRQLLPWTLGCPTEAVASGKNSSSKCSTNDGA